MLKIQASKTVRNYILDCIEESCTQKDMFKYIIATETEVSIFRENLYYFEMKSCAIHSVE